MSPKVKKGKDCQFGVEVTYFWNIHEPMTPVRFMEIVFFGMNIYLCEIHLRGVPTTNAIVGSKISFNGKVVGLCMIPFRENKHIIAFLVSEPCDGHFGSKRFIVPVQVIC